MQDKFRVFHNGAGSYDVIAPKIKELLKRHRDQADRRPGDVDVRHARHSRASTGTSPRRSASWRSVRAVTTSPGQKYAIGDHGFDSMLGQFRVLAQEWLEHTIANRHHGFSNVTESLEEIHKGVSKAYPCGAGLGLLGVSTDGDVALFIGLPGPTPTRWARCATAWIARHRSHFSRRTTSRTRPTAAGAGPVPLCSGGCYHEAHVRYGTTTHPNLHYCEWIRGWTDTCLRVYGECRSGIQGSWHAFDRDEVKAEAAV